MPQILPLNISPPHAIDANVIVTKFEVISSTVSQSKMTTTTTQQSQQPTQPSVNIPAEILRSSNKDLLTGSKVSEEGVSFHHGKALRGSYSCSCLHCGKIFTQSLD